MLANPKHVESALVGVFYAFKQLRDRNRVADRTRAVAAHHRGETIDAYFHFICA
jgi:hypothetical protein